MTWVIAIIILSLLVGCFVYFKLPLEKKDELSKTVSIIGIVTTTFSLLWAAYTYKDSADRQRELSAYSTYQDHMKLSMQYPLLAKGSLAPKPPTEDDNPAKKIEDKIQDYERYQWYVGHALLSFESILEVKPDDPEWKDTFRQFIKWHERYIKSKDFPCENNSERLLQLVKEVTGRDCPKRR